MSAAPNVARHEVDLTRARDYGTVADVPYALIVAQRRLETFCFGMQHLPTAMILSTQLEWVGFLRPLREPAVRHGCPTSRAVQPGWRIRR